MSNSGMGYFMQRIFDAGCSAAEYQDKGKDYRFPDLCGELCPHCGADLLRKHGYYKRYLILLHFTGVILARRYICKTCGRTVSLLPSFAHPGRAYGVRPIVDVLNDFYAGEMSVSGTVARSHLCSRQLLRWFRIRVEQNLNMLIMEMTIAASLRAPPVTETAIRKRVGQFFQCIRSLKAEDISLKIFERTGKTYLSPLPR
jgi:transposase-like protein